MGVRQAASRRAAPCAAHSTMTYRACSTERAGVSPFISICIEVEMAPRNRQGLYDPRSERDACGFGMVAQLDDQPSRLLVDTAIAALSRMTHRGGVAADGLTGDGC